MSAGNRKLLAKILDRVAEPGEQTNAVFLFDEVLRWPPNAITGLGAAKLLKEIMPADAITCYECDERCRRPVTLIEGANGRPPYLSTTCHLKAEFGPFEHSTERVKRWTSSRELVAKFVGRSVGLSTTDYDDQWRRVRFGTLQIGGVRRLFSVELDSSPIAKIGSAIIPLIELLEWEEAGIGVSAEALAHYASQSDDALSGSKRVQPSTTVRDDNKQLTMAKTRRLQGHLNTLAREHPKLNKEQLVRKLEKAGMGEGSTVPRIMRITRMPQKISRRKNIA